jgi:hypothetical protein
MIHGANLSVELMSRNAVGPVSVTPDLVLSVPEPDISLHFLIQPLKVLNQVLKSLIQRLI